MFSDLKSYVIQFFWSKNSLYKKLRGMLNSYLKPCYQNEVNAIKFMKFQQYLI